MRLRFYFIIIVLINFSCDTRGKKLLKANSQVFVNDSIRVKQKPNSVSLTQNNALPPQKKESFPTELLPFVPSGFEVYTYTKGDLSKDGLSDYILVLENTTEDSFIPSEEEIEEETEDYTPPEPELRVDIIMRGNNKLKYLASNNYLYSGKEMNSYLNDSIRLVPGGGGFIVSYSASGAGPTSIYSNMEFHFTYKKQSNQFFLTKKTDISGYNSPAAAMGIKMGHAQQDNPNYTKLQLDSLERVYSKQFTDKESVKIETPKDFGVVSYKQFKKSHYL
jgi:hypothetical protein